MKKIRKLCPIQRILRLKYSSVRVDRAGQKEKKERHISPSFACPWL